MARILLYFLWFLIFYKVIAVVNAGDDFQISKLLQKNRNRVVQTNRIQYLHPLPTLISYNTIENGKSLVERDQKAGGHLPWSLLKPIGLLLAPCLFACLFFFLSPHFPHIHTARLSSHFSNSFLLTLFSEIGDKTFFLTAMLCAKHHAHSLLAGLVCVAALLSVAISSICMAHFCRHMSMMASSAPQIGRMTSKYSAVLCDLLVICIFSYYGVDMIKDSFKLRKSLENPSQSSVDAKDVVQTHDNLFKEVTLCSVLVTCYTTIFLAEIGDRSFFSLFTLSLKSHDKSVEVLLGAFTGQMLCSFIAMACGDLASRYLKEHLVAALGGVSFLLFALFQSISFIRNLVNRR